MKHLRIIFLISSFLLTTMANAHARFNLTISAAPPIPNNVVIMPPAGYANCYWTSAGFYNGIWMNAHQVCQYPNAPQWVQGYWQCHRYRHSNGQCLRWRWVESHWSGGMPVQQYVPQPVYLPAPAYPPVVEYSYRSGGYHHHHHHHGHWR